MVDSPDSPITEQTSNDDAGPTLPPGDHPLEVAARKGFGPLSDAIASAWHGESIPCVSCGQLVRRTQISCDECGQDLSERMLVKMRAHAGPWYVLEHLRPFPGVTLDRIIRQIRRGLITETSIVRGPATDHQWRYAVETPGLCRYFGRCWHCHNEVAPSDSTCTLCRSSLNFVHHEETADQESKRMANAAKAILQPTSELRELSAAVGMVASAASERDWDSAPRIGRVRATWIAGFLLIAVIAVLIWATSVRRHRTTEKQPTGQSTVMPTVHPVRHL